MRYQPVEESSLRHLFSSCFAEESLKLTYLGPVLNAAGRIEDSPDCLVLDRRRRKPEILRCEFKYSPTSAKEFEHNGRFDLAIVWKLAAPLTKKELGDKLSAQNGCREVIILSESKEFAGLKPYENPRSEEFNGLEDLRRVILQRDKYSAVYCAFIAASIYPKKFRLGKMLEHLSSRFEDVRNMRKKGKANAVTQWLQTKPPLIRKMHGAFYRWTDEINSGIAVKEMLEIIHTNFAETPPSPQEVEEIEKGE